MRALTSYVFCRDLTKLEEGLGEKVVMFVHFMVSFVGSIILALVMGWQLALVCMASLPITFIVIGVVAMVSVIVAFCVCHGYNS